MFVPKKFIHTLNALYSDDTSVVRDLLNEAVQKSVYTPAKDAVIINTGVQCLFSYHNGEFGQCELFMDVRNLVLIRVHLSADMAIDYWDRNASTRMLGLIFEVDNKGNFQPTRRFIQQYDERLFQVRVGEFRSDVQRSFLIYGLNYRSLHDGINSLPISSDNNPEVEALESSLPAKYGYLITHYSCGVNMITKFISDEEFVLKQDAERREENEARRNAPYIPSEDPGAYYSQAEEMDQIWRDELNSFGMSDVELDRS